jgi:hypothetical protein
LLLPISHFLKAGALVLPIFQPSVIFDARVETALPVQSKTPLGKRLVKLSERGKKINKYFLVYLLPIAVFVKTLLESAHI